MSRRSNPAFQREITNDSRYGNNSIAKFINLLMVKGKKSIAQWIVYEALEQLAREVNESPAEILHIIIENIRVPTLLRSARLGGTSYKVPYEITYHRSRSIALKWVIAAARSRSEYSMIDRLHGELKAALNKSGGAIKSKETLLRTIDSNQYSASLKF